MFTKKIVKGVFSIWLTCLLGCATSSYNLPSCENYSKNIQFYTCQEISTDLLRVFNQAWKVGSSQERTVTNDLMALGFGIFFWPALIVIPFGDHDVTKLEGLKCQFNLLEQKAIKMNCEIAPKLIAAKKERDKLQRHNAVEPNDLDNLLVHPQ